MSDPKEALVVWSEDEIERIKERAHEVDLTAPAG